MLYPQEGFNTQPPEGGWAIPQRQWVGLSGFNTQPPEGGWAMVAVFLMF